MEPSTLSLESTGSRSGPVGRCPHGEQTGPAKAVPLGFLDCQGARFQLGL